MDFEPTSLSCSLVRETCCPSIQPPGKRRTSTRLWCRKCLLTRKQDLATGMGNGARLFRGSARSHQTDCHCRWATSTVGQLSAARCPNADSGSSREQPSSVS
jgi:hypothetical protein